MTQADSVHSTPRTDSSPFRRLTERELDPRDVIAEILEEHLVPDTRAVAGAIVQHLRDSGFEIKPIDYPKRGGA